MHKYISYISNLVYAYSLPGSSCIRCLHLKLQSKNVLQVLSSSKEVISKCYTNEELAEANCPTEESLRTRSTTELILFSKFLFILRLFGSYVRL